MSTPSLMIIALFIIVMASVIAFKLWIDHREMKAEGERLRRQHENLQALIRGTLFQISSLNVIHVDFVNKRRCG